MQSPHNGRPLRPGLAPQLLLLGATLAGALTAITPSFAQVTVTELNPNQSTLDASDPDGASGGRVNGLASVAANGRIFYAASEWGGLYKSVDTGRTWSRLNSHLPTVTWDVEVSPADANRVFATSFYDGRVASLAGINVSSDGGNTWTHPPTATPPAGFCAGAVRRDEPSAYGIGIDPANPRNVYVGTNCGLAISNDAGGTWRYVDSTPGDPADDVWDVIVHHGGIIDLCGDDGHRRSTDGGNTWTTAAPTGTSLPSGRCSLTASPDEAYVLFAVAGTSIFESDDGGNNWSTQFPNPSAQGRIPFLATNQRSGAAFDLWFGDVTLWRAGCTTPAAPAPGGAARCPASNTWAGGFTRGAGAHDDSGDIVFSAPRTVPPLSECLAECEEDREICLQEAGQPGGPTPAQCAQRFTRCRTRCRSAGDGDACPVLFSSDGGVYFNTRATSPACHTPVWEQPNVTPHGLWIFGLGGAHRAGVSAEDVYFGCQDNGTFATTTAGTTWFNRDCCDGFDASASTARVLYTVCCFSPAPANRLFLRNPGMTGGGEINTYPAGALPGFRPIDIIDRFGPDHYIVLTNQGLFITTNIGANPIVWTQLGAATSPPGACGVRAAGPTANPSFYVQAGGCGGQQADRLWRFTGTAAGGTWQQVNPPGGMGGFGIFAVDPGNPNRLFASHVRPAGPQMILSTDGGATWANNAGLDGLMTGGGIFRAQVQRGPTNFTGFGRYPQPTLVAFDPANANTLVAGGADSGVFLSTNGGSSWTVVTNNSGGAANPVIPRPQFAYFDREGGQANIYVGTQGRGVWRLRYPIPVDPECLRECDEDRRICLQEVGQPGAPTPAQCAQRAVQCRRRCQEGT